LIEISGYKIKKTLGQGGMSTVYLAVQKSVDRYVALKVMSPDLEHDETSTKRFLREARIAARFRHDNIISILDVNVANGVPYIAMEYVPGGQLDTERIKSMSLTEKLSVIIQIADALAFLHSQNFVHRDIKPSNILFREDNTAVLTDFGIASDQSVDTRMTKTGYIMGTPHYMSPEQASGGTLDATADLYSLGVMLFRVLAGRVPFSADDAISVCTMHMTADVPDLPPDVAEFDPIVKKAMAKKPADRYASANELIEELISVTGSETARLLRRSMSGVALEATAGDDESSDSVVERFSPYHGETKIQPSFGTGILKQQAGLEARRRSRDSGRKRKKGGKAWRVIAATMAVLVLIAAIVAGLRYMDIRKTESQLATAERWLQTGDLGLAELKFNDVLARQPGNEAALEGLRRIASLRDDPGQAAAPGIETGSEQSTTDGPSSTAQDEAASAEPVADAPAPEEAEDSLIDSPEQAAEEDLPAIAAETDQDEQLATESVSPQEEPGAEAPVAETPEPVAPSPYAEEIAMLLERSRQLIDSELIDMAAGSPSADLRRVLFLDPENSDAATLLNEMSNALLGRAYEYLTAGELESARWMLDESELTQSGDAQWRASLEETYLEASSSASLKTTEVQALLAQARQYLSENKLTRPEGTNAVAEFRKVLELDPGNSQAMEGLNQVGARYLELARDRIASGDWDRAETYWQRSNDFAPGLTGAAEVRQQLDNRPLVRVQQPEDDWPQAPPAAPAGGATDQLPPKEIGAYRLPRLSLAGDETADTLFRMAEESKKGGNDMRAYALYKEALKKDPYFARAEARLNSGAQSYITRANRDIGNDELFRAHENLSIALALDSSHRDFEKTRRAYLTARDRKLDEVRPESAQTDTITNLRINTLLGEAQTFLDRFLQSDSSNHYAAEKAKEKYEEVLAIQDWNHDAKTGLTRLFEDFVAASYRALDQNRLDDARFFYEKALEIYPNNPELTALESRLEAMSP
jgi:serine/threonine protein kinase